MQKILFFLISVITTAAFSQAKTDKQFVKTIAVTENTEIGFKGYNKEFELFSNPYIIVGDKKFAVQNFEKEMFSSGEILSISPDKKFIVMDYISMGWLEDGTTKSLQERYYCVVIDLVSHKVEMQLQSDCGGEWNDKNQFVSNSKVVFEQ